jgi:hypothetical protein
LESAAGGSKVKAISIRGEAEKERSHSERGKDHPCGEEYQQLRVGLFIYTHIVHMHI